MPTYRVDVVRRDTEYVTADNEWMAAIEVADGLEFGEVVDVRQHAGRVPAANGGRPAAARIAPAKPAKVAKKRKPMSAETRAKLAANLVKARKARAVKAAKKARPRAR